jgi:hypothetical protein
MYMYMYPTCTGATVISGLVRGLDALHCTSCFLTTTGKSTTYSVVVHGDILLQSRCLVATVTAMH